MPRYRFHLATADDWLEDPEGTELPDADAAERRALAEARSLMAEDARSGFMSLRQKIEVHDEAGAVVLVLPFAQAVRIQS